VARVPRAVALALRFAIGEPQAIEKINLRFPHASGTMILSRNCADNRKGESNERLFNIGSVNA